MQSGPERNDVHTLHQSNCNYEPELHRKCGPHYCSQINKTYAQSTTSPATTKSGAWATQRH